MRRRIVGVRIACALLATLLAHAASAAPLWMEREWRAVECCDRHCAHDGPASPNRCCGLEEAPARFVVRPAPVDFSGAAPSIPEGVAVALPATSHVPGPVLSHEPPARAAPLFLLIRNLRI